MSTAHETPYRLAHHFEDPQQQREATTIGMWLFLVTEVMFFGGMFVAYALFRARYAHEFALASHELDIVLGGVNTAVLIASSLTMALAVWAAQVGRRALLVGFLALTLVLGATFLVIKYFEYSEKFEHHLFPGASFQWTPGEHGGSAEAPAHAAEQAAPPAPDAGVRGDAPVSLYSRTSEAGKVQLFFFLYFALTGVHALHMVIGLVMLGFLIVFSLRGLYRPEWYTHVELIGLYWHFVDIAWIFIFPLLYLIGRHL